MARKRSFLILKLLLFTIFLTDASKLNVPHVLLPIFQNVDVSFQLEAVNGGCYKWTTTRSDIVQLTLIDPTSTECSSKALVSSISREPVRNVAVVIAEDVETQLTLRTDVIVDVIDKLCIVTTTKEIIMQEIPEVFKAVAYDSQGNQFTSLQGVEFDWKIISLGANKDTTVLRFITFKESPYETPPSIEEFEEIGKNGDIVLLEGVKTGSAKLQVKLPHQEYSELKESEVLLSVVANLIILPADAYIIPYDVVTFRLYAINNGKMEEISLPDSQYFMDIENAEVASVDAKTGEVTGLEEGRTKVLLRDRNAEDLEQQKLPSAYIHVCLPSYITLSILPFKNWAILMNTPHVLLAEVFSSSDHKLEIGPGVELQIQMDEKFLMQERSSNGTWLLGWGQQPGKAPISVSLDGVFNKKFGRRDLGPIVTKQEIKIFPTITVKPSDVILPWDPVSQPRYEIPLNASGGDGKFLWISTNHSVGVVTQNGLVKTHSDGEFEVAAVMQQNHNNRESAKFYIIPPTKLEIIEYITEAEIDTNIFIHIAIYGEKPDTNDIGTQIPFTQCQNLPFKVQTSDPHFVINNETMETIGVSCANVAVTSSIVGSSKVSVIYNIGGKNLEDSVVISTFKPLRLIFPESPVVLALGTSTQLIFTGGPKEVQGKNVHYLRNISVNDENKVEMEDVTDKMILPPNEDGFIVINVLCKSLGESEVTLSIVSAPSIVNKINTDCRMKVIIICGKPRTISLQPEVKVENVSLCPMDLSSDKVLVQTGHDIELDVTVKDENGLKFLNISSLLFEWELEPSESAVLTSKDGVIHRDEFQGSLNFGNKTYQIIKPKLTTSDDKIISVKAKIVGYNKKLLTKLKITPEWPEFLDESEKGVDLPPITSVITLILVDDTQISPNELTVYNHPSNKHTVDVKYGSGYYEMLLSNPDTADVIYSSNTRQIEITPRKDGELRIDLVDLCLGGKPPSVFVRVVSVSIIRVEMSDKVEVNKCITCTVKLYDESDNLLKVPNVDMIGIEVDQETDVANFNRLKVGDDDEVWPDGHIKYLVQGDKLGETKVKFTLSTSIVPVESAPLELQIFGPLRIQPKNLTTLIGTNVQFAHEGGPLANPTMEYALENTKIGEISTGGLLNALQLGSTKVIGKCIGINPTTGQKVVYATDTAEVHVIPIQGFKIKSPLTRFRLKTEVPVWVTGIPENLSPMILGAARPDYIYQWTVDDPDIVQIVGVFEPLGVTYDPQDQISIRIRSLRPGKTRLNLNVTVPGNVAQSKKKTVTFSDSLEFEVFEGLALMSPAGFSGKVILMAPYASLQLMTNVDSSSRISYKLVGNNQSIITVTSQGMVKSEDQLGYSTILVTSIDQYGLKQTLSLIVEVKAIFYMRLNVVADWTVVPTEFNNIIPLGTEFQLRATFHDNTGNEFSAGTAPLHLRTSRSDLTRIKIGSDNFTLSVSIAKPGITVLKVWADGVQKTADYIKMNVNQAVVPRVNTLVGGDVVCMWTPVSSGAPGLWSSSDGNLFTIDSESGIGMATASRGGKVYLSHTLHPVAPIQLQIVPISQLKCLVDNKPILTNSIHSKPLEIPVVIIGEGINRKNNLLNAVQCEVDIPSIIKEFPIECEIEFKNASIPMDIYSIFQVEPSFNPKTGTYGCTISPTGLADPNTSTLDTSITLTVRSRSNNVVSEPLEIEFLPAVYMEKELTLDEYQYSAELIITGTKPVLGKIKVTPFDPNLLEISKPEKINSHTIKYKVKLVDYHWKLNEYEGPLLVKVYSQLTEENIKVNVKVLSPDKFSAQEFAARGQSPLVSYFYKYRHILIIVTSMLVIFIGTFYAYSQFVQPVIHVNVTPVRSLLSPTNAQVQRNIGTPRAVPGTSACPCNQPNCPHNAKQQRSFNQSCCIGTSISGSMSPNKDSVYGDPSSFYSTSPEMRRNRRFM